MSASVVYCWHVATNQAFADERRTTRDLGSVGGSQDHCAKNRASFAHLPARCRRPVKQLDCRATRCDTPDGVALAQTLCGARPRRPGGGCAAWPEQPAHKRQGNQSDGGSDLTHHATGCDSLEHADDGGEVWGEQRDGLPDLGCAWLATPSSGDVQIIPEQAVCKKVDRCGWPLPQSAQQSAGIVCG